MDIREKVKNDMRKIASDGADISSFVESKLKTEVLSLQDVKQTSVMVFKNIQDMYQKINHIIMMCGYDPEEYVKMSGCEPAMTIERIGEVYHFTLKGMIPHKITYDVSAGKKRYSYNKDILYSGYRRAVEDYLCENRVSIYKTKVLVAFVHYYPPNAKMIDHDNLHTKTFIDAVLKHIFIPDDSPACMDLYHTCRADDNKNTHTEVYVGQIEAVLDLINRQG